MVRLIKWRYNLMLLIGSRHRMQRSIATYPLSRLSVAMTCNTSSCACVRVCVCVCVCVHFYIVNKSCRREYNKRADNG